MSGELRNIVHYPYLDPHVAQRYRVHFWHVRARILNDPARTKHFWYKTPNPEHPSLYRYAANGKPDGSEECLFMFNALRARLREKADVIAWCEGEKDANNVWRKWRIPATSHHGGAAKATPEQAAHFRGYRGTVLIMADRDEAGYACASIRHRLLRRIGVRTRVLTPAPEVYIPGGGECGDRRPCECAVPCSEPGTRNYAGVDISDHIAFGARFAELKVLPAAELRPFEQNWATAVRTGVRYNDADREFTQECLRIAQEALKAGVSPWKWRVAK